MRSTFSPFLELLYSYIDRKSSVKDSPPGKVPRCKAEDELFGYLVLILILDLGYWVFCWKIQWYICFCHDVRIRVWRREVENISRWFLNFFLGWSSTNNPHFFCCQTVFVILLCNNQLVEHLESSLRQVFHHMPAVSSFLSQLLIQLEKIENNYHNAPVTNKVEQTYSNWHALQCYAWSCCLIWFSFCFRQHPGSSRFPCFGTVWFG